MSKKDMPERIWAGDTELNVFGTYIETPYWGEDKGVLYTSEPYAEYIRADVHDGLVDALQIEAEGHLLRLTQVRRELSNLARESIDREKQLALLEAEVQSLRVRGGR